MIQLDLYHITNANEDDFCSANSNFSDIAPVYEHST